MNEFRMFMKLVEVYARATKKPVGFVIHPSTEVQVVGEKLNLRLAFVDPDSWVTKISNEILRNLEQTMRDSIPDYPDQTEFVRKDK